MDNRLSSAVLALIVAAAVTACGRDGADTQAPPAEPAAEPAASEPPAPSLSDRLAASSRSDDDKARDAGRKPAAVIAYLGIEPGMRVMDVMAAGGWYTEVLSVAVGPDGSVVAQNPGFMLQFRDGANDKALNERLAGGRLPNVSRLDSEFEDLSQEDGSFDAALTALNLHDVYNTAGEAAAIGFMRSVLGVLKPGGVFGVIDHAGIEGQDNAALHRMLKADAIRVAEAAGFVVEGDGDVLSVAEDDHTQRVFAEGLRGNTDRFLLKLRKPE